jgi:hypothetical protein
MVVFSFPSFSFSMPGSRVDIGAVLHTAPLLFIFLCLPGVLAAPTGLIFLLCQWLCLFFIFLLFGVRLSTCQYLRTD